MRWAEKAHKFAHWTLVLWTGVFVAGLVGCAIFTSNTNPPKALIRTYKEADQVEQHTIKELLYFINARQSPEEHYFRKFEDNYQFIVDKLRFANEWLLYSHPESYPELQKVTATRLRMWHDIRMFAHSDLKSIEDYPEEDRIKVVDFILDLNSLRKWTMAWVDYND